MATPGGYPLASRGVADTLSQHKQCSAAMSALGFHNREHLALGNHVVNADED